MGGLFAALGTGARALMAHQNAVRVAGNNIANASTEGYTRQRVNLTGATPEDLGVGLIGRGVEVESIQRLTDEFVDRSLRKGDSDLKSLEIKQSALSQAETLANELSDSDLSTALSRFFEAIEALAQRPEDMAVRRLAVDQAGQLAQTFQNLRKGLNDIRKNLNDEVGTNVTEVNALLTGIADLNQRILDSENASSNGSREANDLRDRRDLKLRKLSEYLQIKVFEQSDGQVNVFADGDPLVTLSRASTLGTSTTVTGGIAIATPIFVANNGPVTLYSGRLEGLVTSRDTALPKYIADLDALAKGVIQEFNKIHADGIGLNGHASLTGTNAVTGAAAVLNAAGLDLTPVNGSLTVNVTNRVTGAVVSTVVDVDLDGIGADATLTSLAAAIGGLANIGASVTADLKLLVTADSADFTFTFSNDTSNALAALGMNTLFMGKDASDIAVNSLVDADLSKLAAAQSSAKGDNAAAVAMSNLRTTAVLSSNTTTLEEFWRGSVGTLAVDAELGTDSLKTQQLRMERLENERQEVSGVNIDEEMTKLMQFQRAFQGSARFISIVDDMLDTIVNRLF